MSIYRSKGVVRVSRQSVLKFTFRYSLKYLIFFSTVFAVTPLVWSDHLSGPPVPQDDRVFFVDESKLPFESLPGTNTQTKWGVLKGAGYRIEIPANWNGDLVMYTHGFRGNGDELTVDSPPLRPFLIANGYAWAASSYSKNFYDVKAGVESTNQLARYFRRNIEKPKRTFITGFSMGGHVIGAAIEQFPNIKCPEGRHGKTCRRIARLLGKLSGGVKYDGAVPFCGVMGDTELFNYFGDFSYGSETNAGVPSQFPPPPDYATTVLPVVIGSLFQGNGAGFPFALTPAGEQQKALTQVLSGGSRPVFDIAYPLFQSLLFSFNGTNGDLDGVVSGNIYDNIGRVYQFDGDAALTAEEQAFNDTIIRIARDPGVNREKFLRLERVPIITGRLAIPVVSVHTLGDLFVPFSMEQIYAREARDLGRSHYLVSRTTRAIGHCEFSGEELVESFQSMIDWVNTGERPAGDDILDPEVVASPDMGCNFTRGETASRSFIPGCPIPES